MSEHSLIFIEHDSDIYVLIHGTAFYNERAHNFLCTQVNENSIFDLLRDVTQIYSPDFSSQNDINSCFYPLKAIFLQIDLF